ncbi:MAG: transcriptional regulator [Pyramidobacter sp.]|nr:transcriptional regulator [Pyramidobacter sp.]
MQLETVLKCVEGRLLTECGADVEVTSAFSADLMSDVLAMAQPGALLVTGLNNAQILRTAQVLNLGAVLIARGKTPAQKLIDESNEAEVALMSTGMTLYEASARLYAGGLMPCTLTER